MPQPLTIGTRGSQLALWQARHAKQQFESAGATCDIKIIKTQGDRRKEVPFSALEGVGFFTKELELALLNQEIDIAVHSHKDLATDHPPGLTIAAVSYRATPTDLLIIHPPSYDITTSLPIEEGAVIGTSSPRRKNQLSAFRPDINFKSLRGNVPTRIEKLKTAQYDAIVIASAGVERSKVDLSDFETVELSPYYCVPSPAQGVLAYQTRSEDHSLNNFLATVNDKQVYRTTRVERKVLSQLAGGCELPVGVYCTKEGDQYHVWCSAAEQSTDFPKRLYFRSSQPESLADQVIDKLQTSSSKRVFISRNLSKNSYFRRALVAHDYEVYGKSLLEFHPLTFEKVPSTDWIFFTSKRSVRFFLNQTLPPRSVKWGVMGPGTAEQLKDYNITPDFIGEGKDTSAIGRAFAEHAKGQKVLFPINKNSLRSIQKAASDKIQLTDLAVYESQIKEDISLPDADILVFTSPKNVKGYLDQKDIAPQQEVIAIGPKTGQTLAQEGYTDYKLPYTPGMLHLTDAVFSVR